MSNTSSSWNAAAFNANGYMDRDGRWYRFDEESPYEELVEEYEILQYGICCDGVRY